MASVDDGRERRSATGLTVGVAAVPRPEAFTTSGRAAVDVGRTTSDEEPLSTPSPGATGRELLELVTVFAPPAALLTGLLFYFGWVRTRQYWRVFGVDHSVLGLSVHEHLLRGIDAVHLPLAVTALTLLATLTVHGLLSRWPTTSAARTTLRRAAVVCATGSAGLLVRGAWGVLQEGSVWSRATSLSLAVGILTAGLALSLWRHAADRDAISSPAWHRHAVTAVLATMVMLSMFWYFADYAGSVGTAQAQRRAAALDSRAEAVLYSAEDLHLAGPGVEVTVLGTDGDYRYRYEGLLLLLRTGEHYVMVPRDWTPGVATLVVPTAAAPRVDFVSPRPPQPPR